jgi:hypothetical protein
MDDRSEEGGDARFLVLWQLRAPPDLAFRIVMYRIWQAAADLQDAQVWTNPADDFSAQVQQATVMRISIYCGVRCGPYMAAATIRCPRQSVRRVY